MNQPTNGMHRTRGIYNNRTNKTISVSNIHNSMGFFIHIRTYVHRQNVYKITREYEKMQICFDLYPIFSAIILRCISREINVTKCLMTNREREKTIKTGSEWNEDKE